MFSSSSNRCRCLADTATHCTFWLDINIFGTYHVHTFMNNECSWMIVSACPTLIPLLDVITCTVSQNQLFSMANVCIVYSSWLNICMWSVWGFFMAFRKQS
jgi:hypothetical protein